MDTGKVGEERICELIKRRQIFPCYFGSALKVEGVNTFLQGFLQYTKEPSRGGDFGARVFKIARDKGERLTYLKVTGGSIRVKEALTHPSGESEKINQLRVYSGENFEAVEEAHPGMVCAVTGLKHSFVGECFGGEEGAYLPVSEPVLTYQIKLPPEVSPLAMLPKFRELEEEDPLLHIQWKEEQQEILVWVMGEVQVEVLKRLIYDRFHVEVEFSQGSIVYRETIADTVEGVGHFEPLRHYAEVHLLLEPGEPGSGMVFGADCSEDILDKNWQRLVLTHLEEREHRGVLTGSVITDIKITLTGGKAHLKHTEGGDFRQATYRAVRQGLMQADSVLLEPWYEFVLEVPAQTAGRAMTDIERMQGKITAPEIREDTAVLRGRAPVACLQDYQIEVTAYTKGQGHLSCLPGGYAPCHNAEEVIEKIGYDPEADMDNPSSSVFCAHGAGFLVPWYEAPAHMHVESGIKDHEATDFRRIRQQKERSTGLDAAGIGTEEIDAIIAGASHANSRPEAGGRKWNAKGKSRTGGRRTISVGETGQENAAARTLKYGGEKERPGKAAEQRKKEYLLVDGYNIIFAWDELKELSEVSIDGARGRLLDILCNYQGMRQCEVIAVFDAYRVKGHDTEILNYHNIHVVYTREAETADQYIERFSHENGRKYDVTVATSDGLEQIIIRGEGCRLLSARELKKEIDYYSQNLKRDYLEKQPAGKRFMLEGMEEKLREEIGKDG